tara:strand:- start:14510 stop:15025 length:516 start_codon:yes stop_codon:yes gene_type:complete
MKKKYPVNNGKDVIGFNTEDAHSLSGKSKHVTSLSCDYNSSYEPKLINRWLVNFKGDGYKDIVSWALVKTHRPKLINGSWGDIEIILRDIISPSVSQSLVEGFRCDWQQKNIEVPIINYDLDILDPIGHIIEKWSIEGRVKLADFGGLDYAESKLLNIKLILEPINVILVY